MTTRWRSVLAGAFLALQAALSIRAHVVGTRFFCWAPHDMQTEFFIEASIDGRRLDDAAIRRRYLLAAHGWDSHHWRNVVSVLRQREERAAPGDVADVRLRYRVNGRAPETWSWP